MTRGTRWLTSSAPQPGEVVFTSGGTEADNQAIVGVLARTGGVAVCSAIEHHAVLEPVERSGGRVVAVGPRWPRRSRRPGGCARRGRRGRVDHAREQRGRRDPAVRPDRRRLCAERAPRAVLHTDAVQAFTWLDVASVAADADLISVSAHKFGGPKGVGAFVIRDGTSIDPLLLGGGQERDRRSGTQNVAGVVAMAAAARSAADERAIAGRPAHALARPAAGRAPRRPPRHRRDRRHRHPPTGTTRSPAPAMSASAVSRARRCCSCSTRPGSRRPPPRPARAGRWSRPMCWPRWGSTARWPAGRCGCRSDGRRLRPTWTWRSTSCRQPSGVSARDDGLARSTQDHSRRADGSRPGRHVRRRRLIGRGRSAPRRGTRRRRRHDEALGRRRATPAVVR